MEPNRPLNPLPQGTGIFAALDRRQTVLESIREKFSGKGVVQTQSTLRLVQKLPASVSAVTFPVLKDQGAQLDTEIRLDRPDSFTVTDLGFYIGWKKGTAAVTEGPDELFTGPNAKLTASGLTPALIAAMQQGTLSMKMDTVQFLDKFDVMRSRFVGTSQDGLDPGAASLYQGDAADGAHWGQTEMIPSTTFSGAMKQDVRLEFPRAIDLSVVASDFIFAVLVMRGYLNQGGAQFRT